MTYVDLDGTLIHAEENPRTGRVGSIRVRPGTTTFLSRVAQLGPVALLTHATRSHADRALEAIGAPAEVFNWILSREDLQPIIEQLDAIDSTPGVRDSDRIRLYSEIEPIAPQGYMIDDWPVGSWMFWLKSRALDIGPRRWIQVRLFEPSQTSGSGLNDALRELKRRLRYDVGFKTGVPVW